MRMYRSLRWALFVYDVFRLFLMLGIMLFPVPGGEAGLAFPAMAFFAPNALFPLMSLFVAVRPARYLPYLPLAAAGKLVTTAAFLGWFCFSVRYIAAGLGTDTLQTLGFLGLTLLFTILDGLSALGGYILQRRLPAAIGAQETPVSNIVAGIEGTVPCE
ncbi:MAG: hypothetical protein LBT11_04860 [Treponema sp.]|jgi:hypothetical protein|nr:hypothetical protein [Treponema sp.]